MEGRVCVEAWRPYQQTGLRVVWPGPTRVFVAVSLCPPAPTVESRGQEIRSEVAVETSQAPQSRLHCLASGCLLLGSLCSPEGLWGWKPWKGTTALGIKSHTAPAAGQSPAGHHAGLAGPSEGAELCWLDDAAFTVAFDEILPELGADPWALAAGANLSEAALSWGPPWPLVAGGLPGRASAF